MELVKVLCAITAILWLCSCTRLEVTWSDGTQVRQYGAPLVSRTDGFTLKHEWLDEESNTLHCVSIDRNTEENTDAQAEVIKTLANLAAGNTRPITIKKP